jgi:hypothetical protein
MADNDDTIVRIMGMRPTSFGWTHEAPIPADATIYNGGKLLLGSQHDGLGLGWLGEPIAASGAHYAAILADDPHGADLRAHNRAVGAIVLEYVTLQQVRKALADFFSDELDMTKPEIRIRMAGLEDKALWRQYVARGLHLDRAS